MPCAEVRRTRGIGGIRGLDVDCVDTCSAAPECCGPSRRVSRSRRRVRHEHRSLQRMGRRRRRSLVGASLRAAIVRVLRAPSNANCNCTVPRNGTSRRQHWRWWRAAFQTWAPSWGPNCDASQRWDATTSISVRRTIRRARRVWPFVLTNRMGATTSSHSTPKVSDGLCPWATVSWKTAAV